MFLMADGDKKTNYTATYISCDLTSTTLFEVHSILERGQILHRPVAFIPFLVEPHSLHGHTGVDAELGLLLGRGRLHSLSLAARFQESEPQAPGLVL